MSTIGGTQSFWQQDQSYWSNQSGWSSSIAATNAVNNALFSATTTLGKGEAAIANGEALTRTNNQIKSGIQDYIKAVSGSSSGSTATAAAPATATSTQAVSVSTTLSSLGILQNGSVYVTAGKNTTAYTSTGSDTIGDLISALNTNLPANAQVTASINSQGRLVITSKNTTDQISISGVFASKSRLCRRQSELQADPSHRARRLDYEFLEHEQREHEHIELQQKQHGGCNKRVHRERHQRRDPLGIVRRERQPGQSARLIGLSRSRIFLRL